MNNETRAALVLATTERDAEIARLKEVVAAFERDFQDEMSLSQAIVERDVAIAEIARLRDELARLRELFEATRRWGAGETDTERLEKARSAVLGVDGWRSAVLGADGWPTNHTNVQVAGAIARAVIDALAPSIPPLTLPGAVVKQPMNNRFPLDNETRAALVKWFRARATDYLDKAGVLNDVANALEQEEGNGGHLVSDAPCDEAGDAGPDPRLHP